MALARSLRGSSLLASSWGGRLSHAASPSFNHTLARIYELRSTFASNALAAGVTVFELAKLMGTSVTMIERSYGTLLGGAHAGIAGRLDALEASLERSAEAERGPRTGVHRRDLR